LRDGRVQVCPRARNRTAERSFDGLENEEPGLVTSGAWRPEAGVEYEELPTLWGVARTPRCRATAGPPRILAGILTTYRSSRPDLPPGFPRPAPRRFPREAGAVGPFHPARHLISQSDHFWPYFRIDGYSRCFVLLFRDMTTGASRGSDVYESITRLSGIPTPPFAAAVEGSHVRQRALVERDRGTPVPPPASGRGELPRRHAPAAGPAPGAPAERVRVRAPRRRHRRRGPARRARRAARPGRARPRPDLRGRVAGAPGDARPRPDRCGPRRPGRAVPPAPAGQPDGPGGHPLRHLRRPARLLRPVRRPRRPHRPARVRRRHPRPPRAVRPDLLRAADHRALPG